MYCKKCGATLADSEKFCTQCGEKVSSDAAVSLVKNNASDTNTMNGYGANNYGTNGYEAGGYGTNNYGTNDYGANSYGAGGYAGGYATGNAGTYSNAQSDFDGTGLEYFGYSLLTSLVSLVTCGIAAPWMICMIQRWKASHTIINGRRLSFNGTGLSLLGNSLLWGLLTVVTCGIYGLFVYVAFKKWIVKNTSIEGFSTAPDNNDSYFDGNSFEYYGYVYLGGLFTALSLGFAFPWIMCLIQKWDIGHQVINNKRLRFNGTGSGFFGEYIIIVLLSIITCGIYSPWGMVRMLKYITRNTEFES